MLIRANSNKFFKKYLTPNKNSNIINKKERKKMIFPIWKINR
jgi:hypothetical protein